MAYKKDLHNVRSLLDALGNPHKKFKCIHVAGTNGKGSVSHMVAAVLSNSSYKTGLYTSPHLRDFRERIRIDGAMVPKEFVVSFTAQIKPLIEIIEPSFFEVTVAMAFEYFAMQHVDVAVVETGLGGRLDSTNIILPEMSIITNIGFDHATILGDTLAKIAFEKAGIIKQNIPAVIGEALPETLPVFIEKAKEQQAELILAEQEYAIGSVKTAMESLEVALVNKATKEVVTIETDLPGIYQQYNLRTAYTALKILQRNGWELTQQEMLLGLKHVSSNSGLLGRWQVLHKKPWVVADVAHNAEGIVQLVQHIQAIENEVGDVHVIYGTSADKDLQGILPLFPKHWHYNFTKAQLPRAMNENDLRRYAAAFHLYGPAFAHIMPALGFVIKNASPNNLILICGSVFLVGEIDEARVNSLFDPNA